MKWINIKKKLNEKQISSLDSYFNDEEKHIIKKEILSKAIRLFVTLFLFQESKKEIKIKENRSNFVNYLDILDLWDKKIYADEKFKKELNEIGKLDIHINQIIYFYEYLGGDIEDDFMKDVLFKIKSDEELKKQESIPTYEEQEKKKNEEKKEEEEEEEEEEEIEDNDYKKREYNDMDDDRF